jgi:hypothetical protein
LSISVSLILKISVTNCKSDVDVNYLNLDWTSIFKVIYSHSLSTRSRMFFRFSFDSKASRTTSKILLVSSYLCAISSYSETVNLNSWRLAVLLELSFSSRWPW